MKRFLKIKLNLKNKKEVSRGDLGPDESQSEAFGTQRAHSLMIMTHRTLDCNQWDGPKLCRPKIKAGGRCLGLPSLSCEHVL